MFSNTANAPHKTNPSQLAGQKLFVDPNSNAAKQAAAWQGTQSDDAALMSKLAKLPTSHWITSPEAIDSKLATYLSTAKAAKATATLVVYNIPDRDCGAYSAGGAQNLDQYKEFIDLLVAKVGDAKTIAIIEPDAVAAISNQDASGKDCLTGQQLADRYGALRYAVESFTKLANTTVYLDAGNSSWNGDIDKLSERLIKAGLDVADGFSLNVSNFQTDQDTIEYGTSISELTNNKRFVIDTSRNGLGRYENEVYPEHGWCNPPGRALGHVPTTNTGQSLVDAYLYIKYPGESDGQDADKNKCFGGPAAGQWWPEYALELIKRWPSELQ
jgi:endoglucanase